MSNDSKDAAEIAVEFLDWKRPGGPWPVTAIAPDGGSTPTTWLDSPAAVRAFVEEQSGRVNLYYTVGEVAPGVAKKPTKAQIVETRFLHADIDPPKSLAAGDIEAWVAETLERVRSQSTVPPPSLIASSGNGLHLLWRLDAPFHVGGDVNRIADIEGHNRWIAQELGADMATINVDRLLRVYGSVNVPDKRKRGIGRVPRATRVIEMNDLAYSLGDFGRVEVARETERSKAGAVANIRSGGIGEPIRLNAIDELSQWGIDEPDRLRMLIVQGCDPDDFDGDRSKVVFDVCCNLLRRGVPAELVVGIISDKAWLISEHVFEKGKRDVIGYAWRQVDRASELANNSWPMRNVGKAVAWINRRYFAALEGRSVTYFREDEDRVQPMDDRAFHFELADREVVVSNHDGDEKRYPASKLWVGNSARRYYPRGFVIDPSGNGDPRAFNLWRGFGVEPGSGDWSLMQAHILGPLSSGDAKHAEYILNWFAWTVQNPATPPRVALVFRGGEGVGKGIVAYNFFRIFGHHGHYANAMDQIAGRFNSHLRHCCFLVADEIEANGREGGKLKSLITERHVSIEGKGKDIVQADNHLHVVMLSNERWVVPAGKDSRRYAVFDVSDERQRDGAYFTAIAEQMDNGGREAMLFDLLARDLGNFHPEHARPDTDALAEQRAHTLTGFERVCFDLLSTGDIPYMQSNNEVGGGCIFVATSELADFAARRLRREDISWNEVGGLLNRLGFEKIDTRPRGYVLPRLEDARCAWNKAMFDYPWTGPGTWGLPPSADFDGPQPY